MKILRATLAAFAVAALAAAPSADAAKAKPKPKTHVYSVSWTGIGWMGWEGETNEEIGGRTEGRFELRYTGGIDRVVVKGSDIVRVSKPSSRATLNGSTYTVTWDRYSGSQTERSCRGDDRSFAFGAAMSNQQLVALTGDAMVAFRPFEGLEFDIPCSDGAPERWQLDGIHGGSSEPDLGTGAFDAEFDLPAETLGMGKIIQKVRSKPSQPVDCGMFMGSVQDVTECTISWRSTLTFRKRKR